MVTVKVESDPDRVEQVVDEDIKKFDEWFKAMGNDPLVRSEIAAIKTFLYWKLRVAH